jgi:hypothetical protein
VKTDNPDFFKNAASEIRMEALPAAERVKLEILGVRSRCLDFAAVIIRRRLLGYQDQSKEMADFQAAVITLFSLIRNSIAKKYNLENDKKLLDGIAVGTEKADFAKLYGLFVKLDKVIYDIKITQLERPTLPPEESW